MVRNRRWWSERSTTATVGDSTPPRSCSRGAGTTPASHIDWERLIGQFAAWQAARNGLGLWLSHRGPYPSLAMAQARLTVWHGANRSGSVGYRKSAGVTGKVDSALGVNNTRRHGTIWRCSHVPDGLSMLRSYHRGLERQSMRY